MVKTMSIQFRRNAVFLKLLSATIFILLMFGMVHKSSAMVVGYEPTSWNDEFNKIIRNDQALSFSLPSTLPNYADGLDFQYILDNQFSNSISLSSSAVGNPQLYQHIYGFSLPDSTAKYNTHNETGHKRVMQVTEEEVIAAMGKPKKNVKVSHSVTLDGCLLLAKADQESKGFKNLLASFEVLVTKTTERKNGTLMTTKVFKGLVELIGLKNGKVQIKTKGNIKKKYISEIFVEDNLIQVNFNDVLIPYFTRVKVGQDYTLSTLITSNIKTTGSGTGAEVNFGPDVSVVPTYQANQAIPEPATVLLLMSGLLRLNYFRKLRHPFKD